MKLSNWIKRTVVGGGRTAPDSATRLVREVGLGKRLALYDYETGLLALWYFTMRFAEECDRARRYGRSLTVILLEADRTIDRNEYRLLDWMREQKRSTDLVGCLTAGQYLMLLPDTDGPGAELALRRLRTEIDVSASVAEFPDDGANPEELLEAAALRLPAKGRAA